MTGALAVEPGVPHCAGAPAPCFHCGLPNPRSAPWRGRIDGVERSFCCAGCLAIAQTIDGAGLDAYYRDRVGQLRPPPPAFDAVEAQRYDVVAADAGFARPDGAATTVSLLVDGMTCGACGWLVERWLGAQPGVVDAQVNFALRRCRVSIDPARATIASLLAAVARIGYRAHPYDAARREALDRAAWRRLLLRAGLAMLAMMQVMMLALPTYLSDDGVATADARLLDWAALTLTLPVMLYCAAPLFAGAWRGLRTLSPGMDVPIALALLVAFASSAFATLRGVGATYYDSITMFVALLLVARAVELAQRQRAAAALERTTVAPPMVAERLAGDASGDVETIAAAALVAGDRIVVRPGGTIPADGVVQDGRSQVSEAWLTGESRARPCSPGDAVLAGATNGSGALVVEVTACGDATRLAGIARLVEQSAGARPSAVRLADHVARSFVVALLVFAAATALAWWWIDPSRVLAITIAVLVVSCPCALSLATPAVLAAGTAALARRQVVVAGADALETLARVDIVAFDKTGTLTAGRPFVTHVAALHEGATGEAALRVAAALEHASEHPVAGALRAAAGAVAPASDVSMHPGRGIEGTVDGARWRIGTLEFVGEGRPADPAAAAAVASLPTDCTAVALGDGRRIVAVFGCADALRADARTAVASLQAAGLQALVLSGDRASAARSIGHAVGIDVVHAPLAPADKCAVVAGLQRDGRCVAMVGDGVNDAASLAHADVAITFGSATPLAQCTSDVVLLAERLADITVALRHARKVRRIVAQNLAWAVAYNAIALPAAASGFLTPLVASIGMSVSSLVVVLNAARAARIDRMPRAAEACAARPALGAA